nr:hypothetical protein GCM10010200_035310 [Actinomadura rugatobispora]
MVCEAFPLALTHLFDFEHPTANRDLLDPRTGAVARENPAGRPPPTRFGRTEARGHPHRP